MPPQIETSPEAEVYRELYKPENIVYESIYNTGGNLVLKKPIENPNILAIISKWFGEMDQEKLVESVNKVAEAGKNNKYFLILDLRYVTKLPFSLSSDVSDLAKKVLNEQNLKFIMIPGSALHNLLATLLSEVFKNRYSKKDSLKDAFQEIETLSMAMQAEKPSSI